MRYEITDIFKSAYTDKANYYHEFFRIDHTWWLSSNTSQDSVNIYDWRFLCALEHENDWTDWTYEVAKLDCINAELKVVVGYIDNPERNNERKYLEAQHAKLKYLSKDIEFGVILMNRSIDNNADLGIRCYQFTTDAVIEI